MIYFNLFSITKVVYTFKNNTLKKAIDLLIINELLLISKLSTVL